jgi:hypothetical protein
MQETQQQALQPADTSAGQQVLEAATGAAIRFYAEASEILGEELDLKFVADALRSEAQAIEDGIIMASEP